MCDVCAVQHLRNDRKATNVSGSSSPWWPLSMLPHCADHFLFGPLCFLSSFTWLSAQVHSNMVMHFSGRIADSFDREFRCLYADSQIIDCFSDPEEEGLPYYPPFLTMMGPAAAAPGLDLVLDRYADASAPPPLLLLNANVCLPPAGGTGFAPRTPAANPATASPA